MFTDTILVEASDGHTFNVIIAEPAVQPLAQLVLLHEIFGVTEHMHKLARLYASYGFRVHVPALFDRIEKDLVIPYTDAERGRSIAQQCKPDCVLKDIDATCNHGSHNTSVAVIGYCWGGTFAYLAAAKLEIGAAVSYYGTRVADNLQPDLRAPVQFHIGANDAMLPKQAVDKIAQAHPDQPLWIYDKAGHAFACEDRASYESSSSRLAEGRTLDFIRQSLDL